MLYRGPFRQEEDDDGHVLRRGVPTAVCGKTFEVQAGALPFDAKAWINTALAGPERARGLAGGALPPRALTTGFERGTEPAAA